MRLPIAVQVLLLLLGGLLTAQVVTVSIALLLPPRRGPAFRLADIASALKGGPLPRSEGEALVRVHQAERPVSNSAGWIPLGRPRDNLARLLGARPDDVEVQLFIAPPFAGAITNLPPRARWPRRPGGEPWPPFDPAHPPPMAADLAPPDAERPPGPPGPSGPPPGEDFGAPPGPAQEVPPHPDEAAGRGPAWPHPGFGRRWGDSVDGAFLAAWRTGDGWTVVRPARSGLLSGWERRVLLWFVLSLAVMGPVGYLFARRLTAPLAAFARAAERLGRDVRAPPVSLQGPAEVERAARALNSMQVRLQRHVEDRTAMIGAISHDLRTPLARLKFRLEKVSPEVRAPMLADIGQMEAMLASVLTFIRNASEPAAREWVDLRSIAECVVDDAALVGAPVSLDVGDALLVEVDPGAVQRVLANLVDNAVKYGGGAEVRLQRSGEDALVTVTDEGPGLSPAELQRVFEPFYRAGPARTLNGDGVGLGLSIARSIARAHGGEVELHAGSPGLVAELRLPIAPAVSRR